MQFTQKYGPTTFRCQGAVFPLDHGSINLRRNLVQDLSKSKIEKNENFAGIHRPCGNLPVGNYMKLPSVQICNHPWAMNDSKNQASSVVQCMAETIGQRCDRLPRPHNIPQRLWPWQSSLEFPSIFNNIHIQHHENKGFGGGRPLYNSNISMHFRWCLPPSFPFFRVVNVAQRERTARLLQ